MMRVTKKLPYKSLKIGLFDFATFYSTKSKGTSSKTFVYKNSVSSSMKKFTTIGENSSDFTDFSNIPNPESKILRYVKNVRKYFPSEDPINTIDAFSFLIKHQENYKILQVLPKITTKKCHNRLHSVIRSKQHRELLAIPAQDVLIRVCLNYMNWTVYFFVYVKLIQNI